MTSTPAGDGPAARGTRCWSLHGAEGVVDVEVDAPDDGELGTVLGALGELLGTAAPELWAGSTRLPVDLPLTAGDLQHGALLGLGRPGPRPTVEGSSALELQVTGGPEAGRTIGLGTGSHLLGRGSAADIRLDDPDVSRRHAVVAVGGDGISVTDLGSTNGTCLGDRDVGAQPRPWPVGDVLRLGSTSVRVTGPAAVPAALGGSAAGRAVLHPASRLPPHHADVEVAVVLVAHDDRHRLPGRERGADAHRGGIKVAEELRAALLDRERAHRPGLAQHPAEAREGEPQRGEQRRREDDQLSSREGRRPGCPRQA